LDIQVSDLFNEISLEGDISAGGVRDGHGYNIGQSLGLMDHCISIGQVLPVLYQGLTTSYDPADLLLDLI
jgi:hypothetical protein